MEKFVNRLRQDYGHLTFKDTGRASWSPRTSQISYSPLGGDESVWSTLHELGHALMGHDAYISDIDLVKKETEAWNKAVIIGKVYNVAISDEHIQDCLDTYRDWLHKRSTCPACESHGLERSKGLYCCINCRATWKVSSARFCRPYRLTIAQNIQ